MDDKDKTRKVEPISGINTRIGSSENPPIDYKSKSKDRGFDKLLNTEIQKIKG